MMAIVLGVLMTVMSLMVAFFLAVANVHFLVEGDIMGKAMQNAVVHATQYGNLAKRSNVLTSDNSGTALSAGYLRRSGSALRSNITYDIKLENEASLLNVSVEVR